MDELISRNKLLAEYDAAHEGPPGKARELIERAPAEDARIVKRGFWIYRTDEAGRGRWVCGVCGHGVQYAPPNDRRFCYRCGAEMEMEA